MGTRIPLLALRVIGRLLQAESREPDPWARDSYAIARLTVASAARGEQHPHVLATYSFLGLHPDKVWPAIVARRRSMLGQHYDDWYDESGLQRTSPDHQLPAKKPPQSVRAFELVARRQVVGAEGRRDAAPERSDADLKSKRRGFLVPAPLNFGKPAMASPQSAYPNSTARNNAKRAVLSPFNRVAQVRASDLPSRLRELLVAFLSKNQFGDELWLSTESLRVIIGKVSARAEKISRRTVQYQIDKLVELTVLEEVYPANSWVSYNGETVFRHTATYKLNADKLKSRLSWGEWRQSMPVKKPAARTLQPQPVAVEPSPETAAAQTKVSIASSAPKLTTRQRKVLVSRIPAFMRGCKGSVRTIEGGTRWIGPEDPEYREPMSKSAAIVEACRSMCESDGVSLDRALEAAADAGFTIEPKGSA
jgi:hypothetical protein